MSIKSVFGATALALTLGAAPASAAPVNLELSFGGVSGVSVTFLGIDNADGTTQASNFELISPTRTLFSGDATGLAVNSFTFSMGALTDVRFEVSGLMGPNMRIIDVLSLNGPGINSVFKACEMEDFDPVDGCFFEAEFSLAPIDFANGPVAGPPGEGIPANPTPLPAIPVPAGGLLLLSGLAGAFGLLRRKKARASA